MIYEKIAEKELKREGENSSDQKYVTSSYKRMMEEGRKFLEEDAAKEEYNKQHTSENQDNIQGLYKNLYQNDIFMGGYRPDLGAMLKQPQTAPKQPTPNVEQDKEKAQGPLPYTEVPQTGEAAAKPEPVPDTKRPASDIKNREEERRADIGDKRPERRERGASRSRSRSRSKSPTRVTSAKEEEEKKEKAPEKEKEISKEEKLRLMKERYLQRKKNETAGPAPAQSQE